MRDPEQRVLQETVFEYPVDLSFQFNFVSSAHYIRRRSIRIHKIKVNERDSIWQQMEYLLWLTSTLFGMTKSVWLPLLTV
jgi:hypothetical protein